MSYRIFSVVLLLTVFVVASSAKQSVAQEAATPVAVESAVFLSPANANISFVGIHVGDDPKPRLGGFAKFHGYVKVDPDGHAVRELHLHINVDSVWTEFSKLTGHLKNADFFETEKYPTSHFVSTGVESTGDGKCTITGDLTLHGETRSISFPAEFKMEGGGLVLSSQFKLDRSMFAMDKMLSGVDKMVSMTLEVGRKTSPRAEQDGHGGGKKKQSNSAPAEKSQPEKIRKVSLKLPNMT